MGLPIKLFTALLVFGAAGLFVLKKPDGTAWLSINDFLPDQQSIDALSSSIKNVTPSKKQQEKQGTGIYRWKDANGQWQFSDTPPAEQTVEEIHISGNLNRDLTEKIVKKPKQNTQSATTKSTLPVNTINPITSATTISPEQISKLMEDTQNIQQVINNRESQLNQQLEK